MAAFVTETIPDSVYTYIHTLSSLLAAALLTTKIVSTRSLFSSHASLDKVTNAKKKNQEYLVDF